MDNTNNADYSTHNTLLSTLKNSFQNNRQYFFLAIPLILILLFIPVIIISFSSKKPATTVSKSNSSLPPTNKSSQNISQQTSQKLLPVIDTTPSNNATNISIYPTVSATFKNPLTQTEQKSITLNISSSIPGNISWSNDERTIIFTPTQPFTTNQNYTVIISSNNGSYSWSFTTASPDTISTADQQKEQSQADLNYASKEAQFQQNYPWYNDLPLQTETYYVYFDTNSKSFIGILYPSNSSSASVDNQVAGMKSDIQTQLTNLGIPYNNYPLNWEVTPEP